MPSGDTLQNLGPNAQCIFDAVGNLVGMKNPHGVGLDLRVAPFLGTDTYANIQGASVVGLRAGARARASDLGGSGMDVVFDGLNWVPDVDGNALFTARCFKNFKPSNTRKLRNALARVRAGTGRMTIACLGDSTTAGTGANTGGSGQVGAYAYAYPAALKTLLNTKLAAAVDGSMWGHANNDVVAYGTYDPRVSVGTGWTTDSTAGIAPFWINSTTTNALAFTPPEQCDTAVIWYVRNTGQGQFTINVDGGAALATVDSSGTAAVLSQTVTFTKGAHTINIARNGTGGAAYIIGVHSYDSTAPSISVWNWGWHGSTAAVWSLQGAQGRPATAIAAIAPDVVICNIGINDMGTSVATFQTNLQTIVTKALAGGDCILVVPVPSSTAVHPQADQDAVRSAILAVAATNDLPVIDLSLDFESYTQANTSGWMFDTLHPNKLGYADVASLMAKALLTAVG